MESLVVVSLALCLRGLSNAVNVSFFASLVLGDGAGGDEDADPNFLDDFCFFFYEEWLLK